MSDPQYPEVPPTAPATGPPTAPQLPPEWASAPPPPPPGEPPTAEYAPPPGGPTPPPRRNGRIALVVAGAAAVLAGGAFAVTAMRADGGGAATPEEAAQRLLDAVTDEDLLGVADLLPDGERELFRDLLTGTGDELDRLGIVSGEFRLDGFRGIDIVVEDAEFDVEEITDGDGDDDALAFVTLVDGELRASLDGDELARNLGDVVEALADERDVEIDIDDDEAEGDADEAAVGFAVVEEGGRWHPSLLFTVAELARSGSGEEIDVDDAVEPEGADSPEGAVQAMLDAAVDLDAEAAIALLDPGEARALQVYAQLFLPVDADDSDVTVSAELTDAEVDDLGRGIRRVVPTGFELTVDDGDDEASFTFEDGCFTAVVPASDDDEEPIDEEVCTDGDDAEVPDSIGEVEVPDELREVAEAFLPLRFGIVTVERDGEHFVSPLRTVGDVLLGLVRGLERDDLEEGGPLFALFAGDLDDEIETFLDDLFDELEADFDFDVDDFEDFGDDGDDAEPLDPDDPDCEGAGCGFDDDDDAADDGRSPTGASGPYGELLVFDAVAGTAPEDDVATFTAIADIDGDFLAGAEGVDGFDPVLRVLDATTFAVLAENDDFGGTRDAEVLLTLTAGQPVILEVRGFAGAPGEFVVYFEPFE